MVLEVAGAADVGSLKIVAPKSAIVPTEVSEEVSTVLLSTVPVSVEASAVTVTFADPLKLTPLMVLAVSSTVAVEAFVAVEALPTRDPITLPVTFPVTLPVTFPTKDVAPPKVIPLFAVIAPVTTSGGVTVKFPPGV